MLRLNWESHLHLQTDDRFAVGIFMRGEIPWDEDPEVNDNVVVCSFLPHGSAMFSTYRPCTSGYRLYCGDSNLQLYDKTRGNSFVFLTRPPAASGAEIAASIALQKISARVQKVGGVLPLQLHYSSTQVAHSLSSQQIGRLHRTPVTSIELHVVSNRDRVAHQLFDLWFEQ